MHKTKKLLFLWSCCFLVLSGVEAQVKFIWPLRAADGLNDPSYYTISNYVDHNKRKGGFITDYNGGYRTYNGHQGTDIGLYPDPWLKKILGQVDVIAAAAGVIDTIVDGQTDNNCSSPNQTGNYVRLLHSDGKITGYYHLKKNSLTSKQKGDPVVEGEYLGKVASSGRSTGPHLHFGVLDRNGNMLDPFVGPNNPTVSTSLWKNQKPYYDGGINKIYVGSDFITMPNPYCQQQWNLHAKSVFLPGQTVYLSSFIRTPRPTAPVSLFIYQPNGALYNNNTNLYQFASVPAIDKGKKKSARLYRSINLPFGAQTGTWRVTMIYDNQLFEAVTVAFEVKAMNDGFLLNFEPNEQDDLVINAAAVLPDKAIVGELQRSYDGENWVTLLHGIDPTTIESWEYIDVEARRTDPTVYYRVNSILEDGEVVNGDVFHWTAKEARRTNEVNDETDLLLAIYPNPANTTLHLSTPETKEEKRVQFITINGQLLEEFEWKPTAKKLDLMIDHLSQGIYLIRVIQANQSLVKSFVKY